MTTDVQRLDETREGSLFSNKSSYENLLEAPPTRKHGLRWDYWSFSWIGAFVLWLCLGSLVQSMLLNMLPTDVRKLTILGLNVSSLVIIMPLVLIVLAILYTSPYVSINRRVRTRYPRIHQMVKKIPNRQQGEIVDTRLLLLNVDGRHVFLADCSVQGQKYPINGVLLGEDAICIDNDELFRQASMTLNFASAIVVGHSNTSQMKDRVKAELRKIPGLKRVLEQNLSRFERLGLSESAQQAIEGFERVEWAYKERMRFLLASYAYAGAAGYWSADEYFYEDAKRFRDLDVAFARLLSEQHLPDVQLRAMVASALIKAVNENRGGWRNRGKLIQALEFLVGANLVLEHWIKMSTTEVDEQMERFQKGYRAKLDELRSRGFQVVSE